MFESQLLYLSDFFKIHIARLTFSIIYKQGQNLIEIGKNRFKSFNKTYIFEYLFINSLYNVHNVNGGINCLTNSYKTYWQILRICHISLFSQKWFGRTFSFSSN